MYFDKYIGNNLYKRLEIKYNHSTDRTLLLHRIWDKMYPTNQIYLDVITIIQFY